MLEEKGNNWEHRSSSKTCCNVFTKRAHLQSRATVRNNAEGFRRPYFQKAISRYDKRWTPNVYRANVAGNVKGIRFERNRRDSSRPSRSATTHPPSHSSFFYPSFRLSLSLSLSLSLCSAVSAFAGKIFILQPFDIGTWNIQACARSRPRRSNEILDKRSAHG